MAKARVSTNPMYTGGAGGYSFYVRGGEQVVRQRRNNSNYGESASRTEAQMLRRVKWGNLVNVYKAMSAWQPKAYEFKNPGQTDYNIFMSMNINSAMCALTKDMANNGCAVQEGFWVSRGSLPPVERAVTDPTGGIGTNITMTITPSVSTTVGQLSTNIINNNPLYQNGDNIAFIMFNNFVDNRGYPYLSAQYSELTLDVNSTVLLQSISLLNRIMPGDNNDLAFRIGALNSHESGLVIIHTRREGGILKVSSQTIWGTGETLIDQFSGQYWIQSCIVSYGLDSTVPLDPGEGGGNEPSGGLNYFSYFFTGAGAQRVDAPSKLMQPGRYIVSTSPETWDVSGVGGDLGVVTIVANLDGGGTVNLLVFRESRMSEGESPNGETFDIPSNATTVTLEFRGSTGATATVSIRKIS